MKKQNRPIDVFFVLYVCVCMAGYFLIDKGHHDAFMTGATGLMMAIALPGMVLCWLLGQPLNWAIIVPGSLAFWTVFSWLGNMRRRARMRITVTHRAAPRMRYGVITTRSIRDIQEGR